MSPSEVIEYRAGPVRPLGGRLLGATVLVVAGLLLFWWLGGMVWAILHVVELIAAALVIGVVAWKLGVRHGRRHPI